ncbi:hypothetical protein E2542_SST16826 [Spatholobus suberectus]|nr:hypothetical protein E2542_SST16826 [Spatholobus suberectus]
MILTQNTNKFYTHPSFKSGTAKAKESNSGSKTLCLCLCLCLHPPIHPYSNCRKLINITKDIFHLSFILCAKQLHPGQGGPQIPIHLKLLGTQLPVLPELLLSVVVPIEQTINHASTEVRPEIPRVLFGELVINPQRLVHILLQKHDLRHNEPHVPRLLRLVALLRHAQRVLEAPHRGLAVAAAVHQQRVLEENLERERVRRQDRLVVRARARGVPALGGEARREELPVGDLGLRGDQALHDAQRFLVFSELELLLEEGPEGGDGFGVRFEEAGERGRGFVAALVGFEGGRRGRGGAGGGGGELEGDGGEDCGAGEGFEGGENGGFGVGPDREAGLLGWGYGGWGGGEGEDGG